MPCLEERFKRFLASLSSSEEIDSLALPVDRKHPRKADFLLAGRKVIVELKTLTDDTSQKIEPIVVKHGDREDFPLLYGTTDLRTVLSHLSDGEKIYRRIYFSITRSIEKAVRKAEKQISHTRHVLNLPNSVGLLIVLNESVKGLDPTVVGYRVANLMCRTRTGASSSATLDFVWLLFESHSLGSDTELPAFPSMLIRGELAPRYPWFDAFWEDISRCWASSNNAAIVDAGSPNPNALRYKAVEELRKPLS